MSLNGVSAPGQVALLSIEGLDLESAIMAVQTNRVNLIDQQLKDQMNVVQERNQRINDLNANMAEMNKILGAVTTGATPANDDVNKEAFAAAAPQVPDDAAQAAGIALATQQSGWGLTTQKHATDLRDLATKAGVPLPAGFPAAGTENSTYLSQAQSKIVSDFAKEISSKFSSGEIALTKPQSGFEAVDKRSKAEAAIKSLQGQIDALGNTQQMDMLRLQSLSNKRNEAFDIMSNFMKKMADNRSSIIQKM
jgi:hypothetical protein